MFTDIGFAFHQNTRSECGTINTKKKLYNIKSFGNAAEYIQAFGVIQIYSGIIRGRVLNVELYAQKLQKLIYLYLFTDCFMKISLQSSKQISRLAIGENSL